jgi:23S rRNA pseudouridine2457 synthase
VLNKPFGVLCKFSDVEGRPTLKEYVDVAEAVYPAGRLDKDSEGLVLLTDDGWLAHRITHPRHKLPKTYLAQVEGVPDQQALVALRTGVVVRGRRTAPAEVKALDQEPDLWPRSQPVRPYGEKRWLRIVLREGKKRQVRRMTAAVGHPTLRLVRIGIGPVTLGGLQPGQWRDVTGQELAELRAAWN